MRLWVRATRAFGGEEALSFRFLSEIKDLYWARVSRSAKQFTENPADVLAKKLVSSNQRTWDLEFAKVVVNTILYLSTLSPNDYDLTIENTLVSLQQGGIKELVQLIVLLAMSGAADDAMSFPEFSVDAIPYFYQVRVQNCQLQI